MTHLVDRYKQVRKRTEVLCENLSPEDYIPQAVEFTSPPKWHLAHTSWFFEEMILNKYIPDYSNYNEDFSFLFNSYYNSIGQRINRSQRGLITRPGVKEVYAYRRHVDAHMEELLKSKQGAELNQLTILGLNHEEQHQELLITDLKYTFSLNPTYPKYTNEPFIADKNKQSGWLSMNEGVYDIGHTNDGFCFDNELGKHKVYLHNYEISQELVTYGEYMEFVNSDGYTNPMYWLDEGWAWVNNNNVSHPLYWHNVKGDWFHYTTSGLEKIDPTAILSHVSYYEAVAYANFRGRRLPTEFEWEAASDHFEWGYRWEWTNSAYLPYPQFKIKEGAVGEYNGKFMVNQMVLRGSSVATSPNHSRNTYRNFFHPNAQWQFSGIRLAK